ncbi:polyribonucleotide nucleotidyltransferase 1, mitochondrial [Caerostris darwini]|uniref:Polyribonucleotide nucleotidyltransferase 1, mitochondrial n=1 Tax=Caerostris darwini TaxID=1538125 RepID=A0AAV4N4N8_9ARAC|nr:polyribonucleotide nucleotidyltransferase 1, mitochondrial [Caerostris darwini]
MFAPNSEAKIEAHEIIEKLLIEEEAVKLEPRNIYNAKIVEIRDNGVMVTLHPSMRPTLLHNKQLSQRRIQHPSALNLAVGQDILVKYLGRDPANGQIIISHKDLYSTSSSSTHNLFNKNHDVKVNKFLVY